MKLVASLVVVAAVSGVAVVAAPGWLPSILTRISPDVLFAVPTTERIVALTVDDGPSAATDGILEALAAHDARATFFVIGDHVAARPGAVDRLLDAGHEVAHHMMRDEPSLSLAPSEFDAGFAEMDGILDSLGGSPWFRPGSGWYDRRMIATAARSGYRTVLGSVYPFDAQIPFESVMTRWVLGTVHPGAIIVLHDGDERGVRTAAALHEILPVLRRRGYRVVSLSELLRRAAVTAERPADPRS